MIESNDRVRRRIVELVRRAETVVEAWETACKCGHWATTAFNRQRVCDLLEIPQYQGYEGRVEGDPVARLHEAASMVDELDVRVEDLGWRLALADALRTSATQIERVRDARDI